MSDIRKNTFNLEFDTNTVLVCLPFTHSIFTVIYYLYCRNFSEINPHNFWQVFRPLYHVGRILWLDKIVSSQLPPPPPDTSHPTYNSLGEADDDNSTYDKPGVQSRNDDSSHYDDSDSATVRLKSPVSDDSGLDLTMSSEQTSLLNQNKNRSVETHTKDKEVESNSKHIAVGPRAVFLEQNEFEWERIHIGHRFIADHWPHEYQKTLKLLASQFS